jgi:hypothetical protein
MSSTPIIPHRETVLPMTSSAPKAVSSTVLFKAAAGLAMTALAGFGVIAPKIGLDVTTLNGGMAAAFGAVIGIALALNG